MGLEKISYKNQSIEEDSIILSRLQKFMYNSLYSYPHPEWFKEILEDINMNAFTPIPKLFFDEDDVGEHKEREAYIIEMLNNCIDKMQSIGKRQFIELIQDDMKGSFYDVTKYEPLEDEEGYKKYYIGTLIRMRDMMI